MTFFIISVLPSCVSRILYVPYFHSKYIQNNGSFSASGNVIHYMHIEKRESDKNDHKGGA